MARFSIYKNTDDHTKTTPYVLDVQTDLLSDLNTRVVIPLRNSDRYQHLNTTQDLMPHFSIKKTQAGAVVPPVFQPVKALDQDRISKPGTDICYNSAHNKTILSSNIEIKKT